MKVRSHNVSWHLKRANDVKLILCRKEKWCYTEIKSYSKVVYCECLKPNQLKCATLFLPCNILMQSPQMKFSSYKLLKHFCTISSSIKYLHWQVCLSCCINIRIQSSLSQWLCLFSPLSWNIHEKCIHQRLNPISDLMTGFG